MAIGRVPGQTGIQPSIVTAKGDLIVATASGSVTNQAVGSNNQVLMADSAQADGVKWANEATATLTTTGDILYASAANTPARLGIGSTNQVLTVSGGIPAWSTPSSGGMTLITNATPTGVSTYTFSSIPSTYKHLLVLVQDLSSSAGNINLSVRFNSDTAGNYFRARLRTIGTTVTGAIGDNGQNAMYLGQLDGANTNAWNRLKHAFWIYDYANTSRLKTLKGEGFGYDGTSSQYATYFGGWNNTSAVSSITIFDVNGPNNFSNGSLLLYGVS
jgi:hypothetical protein